MHGQAITLKVAGRFGRRRGRHRAAPPRKAKVAKSIPAPATTVTGANDGRKNIRSSGTHYGRSTVDSIIDPKYIYSE